MRKYLYDYIEHVDNVIKNSDSDLEVLRREHLIKISFFQHERLIHLLVTLFYTLFMVIFLGLGFLFVGFLIAGLMLMVFVLFYVVHYFRLEWGVQYLYKQYDKMLYNEK